MRSVLTQSVGAWSSHVLRASALTFLALHVCSGRSAASSLSPSSSSSSSEIAEAADGAETLIPGPLLPTANGPQFVAVSIHAVDMNQDTSGYGGQWTGMHMSMHNETPEMLLWQATGISNPARIIGLPDWAKAAKGGQKYDLQGATDFKVDDLPHAQFKNMVLSILTSRFSLKAHVEMRDQPVWRLTMAKGGLKHVDPPEKQEFKNACWSAGPRTPKVT